MTDLLIILGAVVHLAIGAFLVGVFDDAVGGAEVMVMLFWPLIPFVLVAIGALWLFEGVINLGKRCREWWDR